MGGQQLSQTPSHPSCCFCLHVRTGSILIGLFHMIGQVCAMLLIAFMVLRGTHDLDGSVSIDNKQDASDYCVGLVITFCFFLITSMMIKGIIKYKSSYILPFFCIQLFDFFITSLTAIGLMSYYPDFDDSGRKLPYDQFIMWKHKVTPETFDVGDQWMILVVLVMFLVIMVIKAYCIACVWSCYKFIAACEIGNAVRSNNYVDDAEALLPKIPNYDDAMNSPSGRPPAYEE